MHCTGVKGNVDQRNSLYYKCDVAQSSRLVEYSNELSAHLAVRHLDVTQSFIKIKILLCKVIEHSWYNVQLTPVNAMH